MYIHRIVIDANRINTKRNLEAMNQLEAYHNAGLIELLKTSTLTKEFPIDSNFCKKAESYQTILGHLHTSGVGGGQPNSMPGGVIDRKLDLFKKIFPEKQAGKNCLRSFRDSLHIEQAILNYCDYFVTDDQRLIRSGKEIPEINDRIAVISDTACLKKINSYFLTNYGSVDLDALAKKAKTTGPILLGSNSCNRFRVTDSITNDLILSAHIENRKLLLEAVFYDDAGAKLLTIEPGHRPSFYGGDLTIAEGGCGGIVIGENERNHFMIGSGIDIMLAARVTHTGRAHFFVVNMIGKSPKNLISVERDGLVMRGVEFACQ